MNHLPEDRARFLMNDYSRGFIAFCGFEAVDLKPGAMEARLTVRQDHRQQDGFIHAGVISTLADHTAGYAAFTLVPEDHRILTIEFKINFLRPATGGALICRARVIKPGRQILTCESEVFDHQINGEKLAAKALLTMASVAARTLKK